VFLGGIWMGSTLGALSGPSLPRDPIDRVAAVSPIPGSMPTPGRTSTPSPRPTPTPSLGPTPSPSPSPTPTPTPTPVLVAAPLTGLPVPETLARRPVVAVMVDDHPAARPQSGLNDAGIVWHAPAEGGVPRYMLLIQDGDPPSVGPVRSARQYFIDWAAEWNAVYVHVGGSPQALQTLRSGDGRGRRVYDADEFRWGGRYLWRTRDRPAPHNVYTSGEYLRGLAKQVGATPGDRQPVWRFGPEAPLDERPEGGRIEVPYAYNTVVYRYVRSSNRYAREVSGESRQLDAGTGAPVAPRNVVVLFVSFTPLEDGSNKNRLEADTVGSGVALIATNGRTLEGTWRKRSPDAPTLLFGPDGAPARLTAGQTFVQVVPRGTRVTVRDGTVPSPPAPSGARRERNEPDGARPPTGVAVGARRRTTPRASALRRPTRMAAPGPAPGQRSRAA